MALIPKDWGRFQHYKDRSPSWIKLHKSLLDNYEYHCLPVASKALAPFLWLLASDYPNGEISLDLRAIAFRVRMSEADLKSALKPLIDSGFFTDASGLLADCYQRASPEKRREREEKTLVHQLPLVTNEQPSNGQIRSPAASKIVDNADFSKFWLAYPRKESKQAAVKAFKQARSQGVTAEVIMAALARMKPEWARRPKPEHTPHAATWLNRGGWDDEPLQAATADWRSALPP
jgi:hypothetical protein